MTPSAIVSSRPMLGWARSCFAALLTACLLPGAGVFAQPIMDGDYYPWDNPSTPTIYITYIEFAGDESEFGTVIGNEGLQIYEPFTDWTGINPPSMGIENYQHTLEEGDETKVNVEVGITNYGSMLLQGGDMLRYGHLVIGGSQDDVNFDGSPDDLSESYGFGEVTITGRGTVYNNDPSVIPIELSLLVDPTPRPEDEEGYDVYVGLTGYGKLYVEDGGRLEIEDVLYAGVGEFADGLVVVRGAGSAIDQSGRSETDGSGDFTSSPMQIGVLGYGELRVEEGGTVIAGAGVGIGSLGVGTLYGENSDADSPFDNDARIGSGLVVVEGRGSRIQSAGGVTVGTYFNNMDNYANATGSTSELRVMDNGVLNITRTVNSDGDANDEADLIVGHTGVLNLDNGRINVADRVAVDGMIQGTGRVNASAFLNRRFGTLSITEDQLLRISGSGDQVQTDSNGSYYMANDGLIDVDGGEIVFERVFETLTDSFINRIDFGTDSLPPQPGRIHGQDATMRFRSGLVNQAELAFTGGYNILEGNVENELTGNILLSGEAKAVFLNNLNNLGDIELGPDGSMVSLTVLGSFTGFTNSTLSLGLGSGANGPALSTLSVTGDIVLGGALIVDLASSGASPLVPMPGDEFEIISGTGLLSGAFNILSLPTLSDPAWSWGLDYSNSDLTLVVLDIITLGGDFNGDGFVDASDLAIWEDNFGIKMGASGAQGDADGDGDVDADDYFIWLNQVGGAPMAPIASVTTGEFVTGAVPEPSTVCLMLAAVAGGWCLRRRAA